MQQRQVFFISDGTCITAENFGNSVLTQFPEIEFITKTLPFIKTCDKALQTRNEIDQSFVKHKVKPLVFYTVVEEDIAQIIQKSSAILYPLFEYLIKPLEQELKIKSAHKSGSFHGKGRETDYKNRLDAIDYTLKTDDGANTKNYADADIVLVGVSRCGKTPTCLYLALNFQIKAANYPVTDSEINSAKLPNALTPWLNKCFGLTINPMQLSQIRQERLPNSNYAEISQCKHEIQQVETMFFSNKILSLNTSNTSIEEISTEIISRSGLRR